MKAIPPPKLLPPTPSTERLVGSRRSIIGEDEGTRDRPRRNLILTITLELPQSLEQRLATEAARLGLSLEEYALRLLGELLKKQPPPSSGAELVDYWRREGVIGSRPDIEDSQAHARELRRRAERRTRD